MSGIERYPAVVRDWANMLRAEAKNASLFAEMANDVDEKRAAAWLRGLSEGLRLAAARTYSLADSLDDAAPQQPMSEESGERP